MSKSKLTMRVFLCCFIFVIISCKTTKTTVTETPKKSLVTYSKSSCSGKCPVFSLAIFEDGSFLYTGSANVNTIGEKKGQFNLLHLGYLKNRLDRMPSKNMAFQKIHDKSITSLVYKQQQHQYHSDNVADYAEVESFLKDLVEIVD